jgi:hypothetical protein
VVDRPPAAVGGEAADAVGGIVAERRLARRQRAERAGDEVDRLLLVEVTDQRQFERAVGEAVADLLPEPREGQVEVGLLRLQREARVVVRQDPAGGVAERVLGGGVAAGEEVLDAAAVLRLALGAEAGVADRRGEQLQLQLEVARRGLRGESRRSRRRS